MDKILLNPIFLVAFAAFLALGFLVLIITLFIFKFLRKRIAQDILGMPPPGSPDSETWPYRQVAEAVHPAPVCPWPCPEHKGVVDRLGLMDTEINTVEGRQKILREEILPELPDRFVTRREYDSCKKDRKVNEGELFNRVGNLERKTS
jgi:hypothetical protein